MHSTEEEEEAAQAGICLAIFKPVPVRTSSENVTQIKTEETWGNDWGTPTEPITNVSDKPSIEMQEQEVQEPTPVDEGTADSTMDASFETTREVTSSFSEDPPPLHPSPPCSALVPSKTPLQQVLSLESKNNSSMDTSMEVNAPTKKPTNKTESMQTYSNRKYNLRSKPTTKAYKRFDIPVPTRFSHRSKKVKLQPTSKLRIPIWIPRASKDFRDHILTEVDVHTYHPQDQDKLVEKFIASTSTTLKSQIDTFVYSSRKFIIISWITTMRIFEYLPDKDLYLEVKRIPDRYISLTPQIITSIHCDSNHNFYIAYLWGHQGRDAEADRPYLEMRDLNGNLLIEKPFYYDDVVQEIYSDTLYIYVRLRSNIIHLHRRGYFDQFCYRIDFNDESVKAHFKTPIKASWVATPAFDSYTKLVMLTATSSHLVTSKYEQFNHQVLSSYSFLECPDFNIISINKSKTDFIIHRNIEDTKSVFVDGYLSKVDIGGISSETFTFEPHISLSFQHHILQSKMYKDCIYLFGYREDKNGEKFFEIGCISIKNLDLKPKWSHYLDGVDANTQILVHSDNIALINRNQQVSTISTASREKYECRCCKLCFLIKEDKIKHEENSLKSMFGPKFGLNKIQVPPKKISNTKRLSAELQTVLSSREESSQNDE